MNVYIVKKTKRVAYCFYITYICNQIIAKNEFTNERILVALLTTHKVVRRRIMHL